MKRIYPLLFLLTVSGAFAQLTIKPTTSGSDVFLYSRNTNIFVTGDINLQPNANTAASNLSQDIANFYLRDEAQLIQGGTGVSTNTGNGQISLYQEGTSDEFDYNFWGTPVTDASLPGVGNTLFGITQLSQPLSTTLSDAATMMGSGPDKDGLADPLEIADRWVYRYFGDNLGNNNGVMDDGDYFFLRAETELPAGHGFTMKGTDGVDGTVPAGEAQANNPGEEQRYDFRGRPNSGLIELTVSGGQEYMIGNPYPSALHLNYFLLQNSGGDISGCTTEAVTTRNTLTGIAYFWDSDPGVNSHNTEDYVGGYGSYAPVNCSSNGVWTNPTFFMYDNDGNEVPGSGVENTSTPDARRFSPIGQGFIVETQGTFGDALLPVQFTNDQRSFVRENTTNSVFDLTDGNDTTNASDKGVTTQNRSNDEEVIPKFYLNVVFDNLYTRQLALAFYENSTVGNDRAMDAKNADTHLSSDAGWNHNGEKYVIDIRPFSEEEEVPLMLTLSESKELDLTVVTMENFDVDNIFIYDKITGIYHDIKNDIFTITLDEGVYTDRFKLTFKDDSEVLSMNEELSNSFIIYQNNTAQLLEIKNPNTLDISLIEVYDVAGKRVMSQSNVGTQRTVQLSTGNLAQSAYIVRITTATNIQRSQKVIIAKN